MKAVFRVDATTDIGGGHIMRCLTLASALQDAGWSCIFACQSGSVATVPALTRSGFDIIEMPNAIGEQVSTLRTALPDGTALLIVDNYALDAEFEMACRPWSKRILVIDDLANRPHDADILLDQTYGRDAADYHTLVPKRCNILVGSNYALVRPAFAAARPAALERRSVASDIKRILVSLGSNDPDNVTAIALEGIRQSGIEAAIDVVLGACAPNLASVQQQVQTFSQARLLIDVDDMASLMVAADIAIGASGTTSWERCCLGLPTLTITIAENQKNINSNLARTGAIMFLGPRVEVTAESVADAICNMENDPKRLQAISMAASIICDGRGLMRILLAMICSRLTRDGDTVDLRLMELDDESMILKWHHAKGARRYSRNPESPDTTTHHAWMIKHLHDPDCLPTIIQSNGQPVGVLRFDRMLLDGVEISILLDPEYWGRGIATVALRLARDIHPGSHLWAEIHPDNIASLKIFKRVGFHMTNKTGWYQAPSSGGHKYNC